MKTVRNGFLIVFLCTLLASCSGTDNTDGRTHHPDSGVNNGGNSPSIDDLFTQEDCTNGIDDDKNGLIDCNDMACISASHCIVELVEICDNGIDDDLNGKTDCDDDACKTDDACVDKPVHEEICDNDLDDDSNGVTDCADPACSAHPHCTTISDKDPVEICGNSIDDDDNGLTDCDDPACTEYVNCIPADGDPIERDVEGIWVLPITYKPYTTLNRTLRPTIGNKNYSVETTRTLIRNNDLHVYDVDLFNRYSLGAEVRAGEPWTERASLIRGSVPPHSPTAKSLAWFWQISDPQLVDEESPCRMEGVTIAPYSLASAYRPDDHLSTHMMDVHIQTGKRISDMSSRPFDFVLVTGDIADNAQYNEQEWFMSMIGGGVTNPDSGADDDPIPGPNNDFADPFYSPGIGDIPWFPAIGNHDILYMGFNEITEVTNNACTGDELVDLFDYMPVADHEYRTGYRNGFRDASKPGAPIVDSLGAKTPADPNRRQLNKTEALQLYYDAPGMPVGHGLDPERIKNGWGYYSTYPIPGKPIRLITLDTTASGFSEINIDPEQFKWLDTQLKDAQSKHELVLVQSHHGTYQKAMSGGVTTKEFRNKLASYPNVVAHITGHGHNNEAHVFKADNFSMTGNGYWELMLASIIDFPSQTRLYELVWEGDDNLTIYITNVDANAPQGSFVYDAIRYAAARLYFGMTDDPIAAWDSEIGQRNMILRVKLPNDVAQNLKNYEWSDTIESLTTLKSFSYNDKR